ncbi:MAG: ABC transporter ATP-binding protein [Legionella sp.]|nr:ABC transporter ATP-binding protein [Legionella sp.]
MPMHIKTLVNQFWYLLDNTSKKNLPYLLISVIFLSLLDVVNLGLMGLFLGLLTHSSSMVQEYLAGKGIGPFSEQQLVIYFGLFIVSVFFIKTYFSLQMEKKIVFFCRFLSVKLKKRLMTAYQYAPYSYHLQHNSATMLSKLHNNIDHFSLITIMPCLNLIANTLVCLSMTLFLAFLHPMVTLILMVSLGLFGWFCDLFAKKKTNQMGKEVSVVSRDIIKAVYDSLQGLVEIRVLGQEQYFLDTLHRATHAYAYTSGRLAVLQLIPRYFIENMMVLFIVGLSFSGLALGLDTTRIVVLAGLFAAAGVRLMPLMNQIISSFQQVRTSYHHAKLIYDDLKELAPLIEKSQLLVTSTEKHPFQVIELQNVCYRYPQAAEATLHDLNMTIHQGESVAIIGPSGAGKSTLINLLVGLLQPQKGSILIDGKVISSARAWLNNFAYLPQTIYLLDESIRHNIAFGVADEDIDDQRVWQALETAQLEEVVRRLPKQLETFIGENGMRLSGGQRQRLALARAFYHQRDILVLDEATSALDKETETEVINTIKRFKGSKTLIVIAHRLSTVAHCDKIFSLKQGRICAVGSLEDIKKQSLLAQTTVPTATQCHPN